MEDRHAVASSVFFTGVSLVIEKEKLRQHFESVGHVVSFTVFGPALGKDFRYGIVGYMDPQTAEEAIRRLSGTTFGERAMRVTAARSTTLHGPMRGGLSGPGSGPGSGPADFRKRPREPFGPPGASRPPFSPGMGRGGGGGGGGMRAPMVRAPFSPQPTPEQEQQPPTDKAGREMMQFPRLFTDPILGREGSLVLDALRGMATEEAYAAVEQLRVLALERPIEAKRLLHSNPALKSAVVMTLQHAGRIPFGALPRDAYQSRRAAEAEAEEAPPQRSTPLTPQQAPQPQSPPQPQPPQSPPAPQPVPPLAPQKEMKQVGKSDEVRAAPKREPAPSGGSISSSSAATALPAAPSTPMTEAERDEVLELIQNMSEEDVERVLTMSALDLSQIPDPVQRNQLEVLQRRLLEMSRDL